MVSLFLVGNFRRRMGIILFFGDSKGVLMFLTSFVASNQILDQGDLRSNFLTVSLSLERQI